MRFYVLKGRRTVAPTRNLSYFNVSPGDGPQSCAFTIPAFAPVAVNAKFCEEYS